MKFVDINKLGKNIRNDIKKHKNDKPLNSGVVGEQLIISAYNQMDIKQLEGMRIIINHLIKKKKHQQKLKKDNIQKDVIS